MIQINGTRDSGDKWGPWVFMVETWLNDGTHVQVGIWDSGEVLVSVPNGYEGYATPTLDDWKRLRRIVRQNIEAFTDA